MSEQTRKTLTELANEPFNSDLHIALTRDAQLQLSLRQLLLQLVVKREALGTVLRSRSEDIGQSSVNSISSSLNYNLGVYNNQMRNAGNSTSSYLSLNSVSSLREHHIVLDGSLYGTGTSNQDSEIYKAMYERDFAGHRFVIAESEGSRAAFFRYLRDARRHHTLRQSYRRRRPAQIPDAPAPAAAARLHWPSMLHVAAEVAALAVARLPVACIPIGS